MNMNEGFLTQQRELCFSILKLITDSFNKEFCVLNSEPSKEELEDVKNLLIARLCNDAPDIVVYDLCKRVRCYKENKKS